MEDNKWRRRLWITLGLWVLLSLVAPARAATNDTWAIDFRYAPPSWQTAICLPDDWQKTLVGKDGSLLYDYPGSYAGFGTRIMFALSAAGFTLMSLACASATNINQMIFWRALQGFIGGGMIPTVFAAAYSIFPRSKTPIVAPMVRRLSSVRPTSTAAVFREYHD